MLNQPNLYDQLQKMLTSAENMHPISSYKLIHTL